MILDAFVEPASGPSLTKALRNAFRKGSGEEHLVIGGVTWGDYLEVDHDLGTDRAGPRLYWHEDQLEIMGTSLRHEELKKGLATLLEDYFFSLELEVYPHGQATLRSFEVAGAEPDDSWCLGTQKERPDIVLEIALTSGGLPKLEIYRHLDIPEVWFWRKNALEIWALRQDAATYEGPFRQSRLFPGLNIDFLEHCLALPSWHSARQTFRNGLRKG